MLRNISILIIGVFIGAALLAFYNTQKRIESSDYVELEENFMLSNGSILTKGTLLKIDKSMEEGFTRYILYINKKGTNFLKPVNSNEKNLVKPYWIYLDTAFKK